MLIMKIFIENPDDLSLVTVEEWKKSPDPTIAQFIILMTYEKDGIRIHKNICAGIHEFKEAQAEAAKVLAPNGKAMRNPTRRECLDIYDARFQGLDEVMELIEGDKLNNGWIWTCEEDPDHKLCEDYAFTFRCKGGDLLIELKYRKHTIRPVIDYQYRK